MCDGSAGLWIGNRLVTERFATAGVQLVLSGHEHNYQHLVHGGVAYVITGAGGKLSPAPSRLGSPANAKDAELTAWKAQHHFLLVHATRDSLRVEVIGEDGKAISPEIKLELSR